MVVVALGVVICKLMPQTLVNLVVASVNVGPGQHDAPDGNVNLLLQPHLLIPFCSTEQWALRAAALWSFPHPFEGPFVRR